MRTPLILVMLGALLVACQCQAPLLEADRAEPNDSSAAAAVLAGPFSGTMNEGDAPDVFRFAAGVGQTVTLQLSEQPGQGLSFMDLRVSVTAPGGATVLTRDRVFQGPPTPLQFTATAAGEYLLRLEGFYVGPADSFCAVGRLRYGLSAALSGP